MSYRISLRPYGIHALLIEWPDQVDENILGDILKFKQFLVSECLNMTKWELVPAYNSLTLIRKKEVIDFKRLISQIEKWYAEAPSHALKTENFLCKLPVCYDQDFGIDLLEVSEKLQLEIPEIIKMHTKNVYRVFGIGFLPGFMYLGGLPTSLEISRRAEPRLHVQKGAVGIANKQTGIYPQESPGGWNIIGNCSIPIFDAKRDEPCLVNVGDQIQFYSISRAEYDLHKIEGEVGIYKIEKTKIHA